MPDDTPTPPEPSPHGFAFPWPDPETGETIESAYHYVSRFELDSRNAYILIRVDVHRTQEAAYLLPVPRPMDSYNVELRPQGGNGYPSFPEVVGANQQLFGGVALACYALILGHHPAFQPPPEPEPDES